MSSKFEQFKYSLPGKAARRSSISHMVGCLPFDVQFSSSKLFRMIKRCGTHSLIVLNLRNRIMFVIALEYYRIEKRPRRRDLSKLTRAYFQIGGNLRSRRRAGKSSLSVVSSCCTMRCASFRGSPRARDVPIASFAERTALLSATRREWRWKAPFSRLTEWIMRPICAPLSKCSGRSGIEYERHIVR